ncbi:C-terminal binding protein [Gelria sp. Kuro-4]|uniref:C-terminal binding protein n=1 Tax=Gelria sp. Kuro-4 TaxID=2796927 RepID=UPI001BF0A2ED|nr:C-terminal binding protein [Gelria sp. Kuro-4]BCV25894.1 dehydrogenase [Gelria sp. Kuro-4]
MAEFKVVLTDNIFPDLNLERDMLAAAGAELVLADPERDLAEELKDADAVINTYAKLPASVIEKLERCRLIIRNGIGVDTIDVAAASQKGIMVANIPTYCLEEVATHATALILACNRKVVFLNGKVKAGIWNVKLAIPIQAPEASVVGLAGFGRIPRSVSRKVKALGFDVIAYDPYVAQADADVYGVTMVDFSTLLAKSDYISIHCPLTAETRGMFDYEAFRKMKRSAYLINTARGAVVKEKDLVAALRDGLIAGAALDVLETDGIAPDHPFLEMENVILTPHAAWYSEQSILRRRTQTVEEVIKVLKGGEPTSFVNRRSIVR